MTRSANLDLVRSIYADWERGDFRSAGWADPEIEFAIADGPAPGRWAGLAGMAEGSRGYLSSWEHWRAEPEEFREIDDEQVIVMFLERGRGKTSGVDLADVRVSGASLFCIRDGKVVRLAFYFDRDRALADLGLAPEGDAP